MARRKRRAETLPTIWRVDDTLWADVERVLAEFDPPARFGTDRPAQGLGRRGLPHAQRRAVEPTPARVRRRCQRSPHVPAVGQAGRGRPPVGVAARRVRRVERRRLAVAKLRLCDG